MYSKKALQHFKKPKNFGIIKNADGKGRAGNPVCLLPNEKIHINNKLIEIKNLSQSNKVISHNGKYNLISKIYKRKYKGKITTIKTKLGKTIMTKEHLVFAMKIPERD